jgi:hypothetical protein
MRVPLTTDKRKHRPNPRVLLAALCWFLLVAGTGLTNAASGSLPPRANRSLELHPAPVVGLPVEITNVAINYSPTANSATVAVHFSAALPVPQTPGIGEIVTVGLADPTTTYCVFNDKAAPSVEVTTATTPSGLETFYTYNPNSRSSPLAVLSPTRTELVLPLVAQRFARETWYVHGSTWTVLAKVPLASRAN